MNFLSHYYFNRFSDNDLLVTGSVLPDLVRNADASLKIHPEKEPPSLFPDAKAKSILKGWKEHILIDKIFHRSVFFHDQTHQLRLQIKNILSASPVKPFFVAHIALELLVDHLLVVQQKINVDVFYMHLEKADMGALLRFIEISGRYQPAQLNRFNRFYHTFCQHAYLHSYKNVSGVCYAVVQICKRLWPAAPLTEKQEKELCILFEHYLSVLEGKYMQIFREIEENMAANDNQSV